MCIHKMPMAVAEVITMTPNRDRVHAHTGVVCVLGHPVRHSLSPDIHNAAFSHQGLDLMYLAFDVPPDRLGAALGGIRALGIRGANLTLPLKEAAVHLVDEIDPVAEQVGAVNTVVNDAGKLCGFNTDVVGFAAALRSVLPSGAHGARCLVLGAGGAARAVVAALVADGADAIWVYNRTPERAAALCALASSWGGDACEALPSASRDEAARSADVIVNATSLGLPDTVKDFAVDVDTLHGGQVLVDLVYGAGPTRLVEAARARGVVAIDGREMLVMQAASSYELWTGHKPPLDVMRSALEPGER
jgi:shikimate dehydrogenase